MLMQHVDGENKGKIVLFALSTCGWCKKTRMLLEDVGAEYDYVYLDLLQGDEKQEVIQQVEKWNPQLSFPTMVINDKETIVGFNEDKVREILG
ncbi:MULTISPECIES: glutaredoxin family protein [Methanobacterium]|uniref:Glutaredoxin family protein n=2 Tax=Methanobacterium subterraneum TaxID=59277 RepID=A0A2H4VAF4_9EURY|nr:MULTISPECIES: glutaredoxin family protein [Methanobacterium]MBW4256538.1 glutaredoxin family protein [Methanobacterium sp. YSL]PKL73775.1 MAG: glutaredoxin family protein [Methanobacteriales archaeon HGW-Methanobacteriales-2]AUB55074.1 NrdH-redoxin [Methanobacterium subterraneum]AUB57945.1 NrdH-redoxin [Methanobacterium sp. MZ-A1]AUB61079.1 NrdH-redoxin [Methanobacterium subterraneum]